MVMFHSSVSLPEGNQIESEKLRLLISIHQIEASTNMRLETIFAAQPSPNCSTQVLESWNAASNRWSVGLCVQSWEHHSNDKWARPESIGKL